MARESFQATWAALHQQKPWHDGKFKLWMADQSEFTPYRYDAGVIIGVSDRDEHPGDDFLARPEQD